MKTDQEIFDHLRQFLTDERVQAIEKFAETSSDFVLPVLEDVYQFRNAAAIIRSAEACGFHHVVAMEKRNEFDPNLEVTKGAENWVRVEKMQHNLESLNEIRNRGYRLVAVSPERNAVSLPDFEIGGPVALIFGTEWHGVSENFLEFCDETVAIPMFGFTQSFNVSVAAAICMYELKQKLLAAGIQHFIPEEKQLELKIRWALNSIKSGQQILSKFLQE